MDKLQDAALQHVQDAALQHLARIAVGIVGCVAETAASKQDRILALSLIIAQASEILTNEILK